MSTFASLLQQVSSPSPTDMGLSMEASFMPFTLDMAPLQRFLAHLAQQVEQGQKERDAMRTEVQELKIERRLEALEQGLADLADSVQRHQAAPSAAAAVAADGDHPRHTGQGAPSHVYSRNSTAPGYRGASSSADAGASGGGGGGVGLGHLEAEMAALRERLAQLERKSEALWHVQENEEQLRASIERLKLEATTAREHAAETLGLAKSAQQAAERLDNAQRQSMESIERLQEKAAAQETLTSAAKEERQEMVSNWENTQSQFWDQIRNVEATLSQRLATSETSVASALQEVEEMKEISAELMQRVDEAKRHMGALEGKLESFNTQVATAFSPLHTSIAAVNTRLAELAATKQDISSAITEDDVNRAAARAVDHSDRRCDGIIKSLAGIESRMESLTNSKADRADVVLLTDLQRILDAHDGGMDARMAAVRGSLLGVMDGKADKDELAMANAQLGARLGGLEQAILKGLKAISDKVSTALSEKLALTAFNEFKVQVRAVLADLEDRLRDWSPTGLATKTMAGLEGLAASTCLFCDNRVRSVRDLKALGFGMEDRVFSPERLPTVEQFSSAMANTPSLGAHANAKIAPIGMRKRDTAGTTRINETLPAVPGASDSSLQGGSASIDAMSHVQLPEGIPLSGSPKLSGSGRFKVEVETTFAGAGQSPAAGVRKSQPMRGAKAPGKLPTLDSSIDGRPPSISAWPMEPMSPVQHLGGGLEG